MNFTAHWKLTSKQQHAAIYAYMKFYCMHNMNLLSGERKRVAVDSSESERLLKNSDFFLLSRSVQEFQF
jgi:hypothetical protein